MAHVKLSAAELGLLGEAVQVIPGKVYFRRALFPLRDTPAMHFFSTDTVFVYEPFFLDFGPLNLSCIFRYCDLLKSKVGFTTVAPVGLITQWLLGRAVVIRVSSAHISLYVADFRVPAARKPCIEEQGSHPLFWYFHGKGNERCLAAW